MSIPAWLRFSACCLNGSVHRSLDGIVEFRQGENFGDVRILHVQAGGERAAVEQLPLL